jgi:hypothetical protein
VKQKHPDPAPRRALHRGASSRARKLWPNLALTGPGGQELPAPRDFEEFAANVTVADIAEFAARKLLPRL